MDDATQFKAAGDIKLTVPLAKGFDKILFDFIQIAASKSGFDGKASKQIAERMSKKIFAKIQIDDQAKNHQELVMLLSHWRAPTTIVTVRLVSSLPECDALLRCRSLHDQHGT